MPDQPPPFKQPANPHLRVALLIALGIVGVGAVALVASLLLLGSHG